MTPSPFFILVRVELLIAQAVRSQIPECDPAHNHPVRSEACFARVDHTSRVFMFTDASYSATEIRSATNISFPWKRKSLFARMLDAMHQSRRIQARRLVRGYRHLIPHDDRLGSAPESDLDR
jgi:hypothetical protein